jgi:hypothetical protein
VTIAAGPFYFAWVDAGAAFDPAVHNVMDEYVFSLRRILTEGDKPKLEVEIRNPHIGILNPSRKTWIWLSWDTGTTAGIVPLFNGRVVATPAGIFSEVIKLQFVSWPVDYFKQQQNVAEGLKVTGFYDKVFLDVGKRDDPDSILEANSALWHVDPITLVVSVSDILTGEDGNEDLPADDIFYDGFDMHLKEAPLTAVLIDATVSWTQTARGFVDMGNRVIQSYGGDGIISDWPKPLQSLDGGWSVQYSIAVDVFGIISALTGSSSYSWTNQEKQHEDGDSLSLSISTTVPQLVGPYLSYVLTAKIQPGQIDPFAVDGDGDPSPLNVPASADIALVYCPLWQVNTSLVLRYDAARQRTERVLIMLQADLQAIINDALVTQNSETITKQGADVGIPIIDLLNWTTVSGADVAVDQIIFPDDPLLPGGRSVQICTTAGHAGTSEPAFSDIPGDPTTDGTAVWSSLGTATPTENAPDWTPVSHVPAGEVILPRLPLWTTWKVTLQPGLAQFPQVGVGISLYQIVQGSNGYFFTATLDGTTDIKEPAWPTSYGATIVDGSVTWTCLGNILPDGKTYFLAKSGGTTGALGMIPPFGSNTALHAQTSDNGIVWVSIGSGDIPAGGTPGNVWSRSYFPSERGQKSLQYLIAIGRAHMLMRSRAVEIVADCAFERGISLSCRKTATLHDTRRIPGGVALGKITQAELSVNGDSGEAICHFTVSCAIGYGGAVEEVAGEPVYIDTDYIDDDYQQFTGQTIVLSTLTDVGYSPPIAAPDDDGLVFPLDKDQIVVTEGIKGSLEDQRRAIMSSFASMAKAAQTAQIPVTAISQSIINQKIEILANANSISRALQRNPIYYDAQIKPVSSGPFFDVYKIDTTKLQAPQGINLEAASTP